MAFVSYAQNCEDVILWRALKHIEKGFYVDVGANDPVFDSVTQAFYERGWRGINIEPMNSYYERLCVARPYDINLPVAAANAEGEQIFYEIPETGLSTMDLAIAQQHSLAGREVIERVVPVSTLNLILEEHVSGPIHFLKIDVEGAEEAVLKGLDLLHWRPWILVIEATKPSTQDLGFASWEPLVIASNYEMVYFDGLNRFYLAREKSALAELLNTPPNIFDRFISIHHKNALDERAKSEAELDEVQRQRKQLRSELDEVRTELDEVRTELDEVWEHRKRLQYELDMLTAQLNEVMADRHRIWTQLDEVWNSRDSIFAELEKVYHSRSYRITAPLRAIFGFARILRARLLHSDKNLDSTSHSVSSNLKKIIRQGVSFLRKIPVVAILIDKLKKRFPRLWTKVAGWIKESTREKYEPIEPMGSLGMNISSPEDEKHFLNLFQRELSLVRIEEMERK